MWIVMIMAGMLSLVVANSAYNEHMSKAIPFSAVETSKNVANYNSFATAAQVYMRALAAAPAKDTIINWTTIKAAVGTGKGLPTTIENAPIPANWKIVTTDGSGGYVVCAFMPTTSIAALTKSLSATYKLNSTQGINSGTTYDMAVFAYNPRSPTPLIPSTLTDADKGATQCML